MSLYLGTIRILCALSNQNEWRNLLSTYFYDRDEIPEFNVSATALSL